MTQYELVKIHQNPQMTDTRRFWDIRNNKRIALSPYAIVGIVNYGEDSFIEATNNHTPKATLNTIKTHIQEGATILDIGAVSTRPNAKYISEQEEANKLLEILKAINEKTEYKDIFISIDTSKAFVASTVLNYRCDIINDISGMQFDAKLLDTICEYKPGYVLTYNARNSTVPTSLNTMIEYFETKINLLVKNGLPENNIVLDIGLGFGYSYPETASILQKIEALEKLGRPLFIGASYKTWYQKNTNIDIEQKARATYISTALFKLKGVLLHRVHNVALAKEALNIADALMYEG